MSRAVFLLSDFGARDTYVGQMKAVLFSEAPAGTPLIDLTHEVDRGDVPGGAFHLWSTGRHLPEGSVVLAVVDPGVGSDRLGIIVRAGGVTYVGPDNGLFGLLPVDSARELPRPDPGSSMTFHGRDVFAPAAARILCDPGWPATLGRLDPADLVPVGIPDAEPADGGMKVSVAHIDDFGNIVLWFPTGILGDGDRIRLIPPGGDRIDIERTRTYCEGEGFMLLEGSQGLMEIALDGASAADALAIRAGDRILLGVSG